MALLLELPPMDRPVLLRANVVSYPRFPDETTGVLSLKIVVRIGLVDCSSGAAASESGSGGSSSTSTSGGIFKRVLDAVIGDSRQAR